MATLLPHLCPSAVLFWLQSMAGFSYEANLLLFTCLRIQHNLVEIPDPRNRGAAVTDPYICHVMYCMTAKPPGSSRIPAKLLHSTAFGTSSIRSLGSRSAASDMFLTLCFIPLMKLADPPNEHRSCSIHYNMLRSPKSLQFTAIPFSVLTF